MTLSPKEPIFSVPFNYGRADYAAHVVDRFDHAGNIQMIIEGSDIFKNCSVVTGYSLNAITAHLEYKGQSPSDDPIKLYVYRPRGGSDVVISGMTYNNEQPDDERYRQSIHFFDALLKALIENANTEVSKSGTKVSKKIGKELETLVNSKQWTDAQKENLE